MVVLARCLKHTRLLGLALHLAHMKEQSVVLTTRCSARSDADVQADRTGHFLLQLLDASQSANTYGV